MKENILLIIAALTTSILINKVNSTDIQSDVSISDPHSIEGKHFNVDIQLEVDKMFIDGGMTAVEVEARQIRANAISTYFIMTDVKMKSKVEIRHSQQEQDDGSQLHGDEDDDDDDKNIIKSYDSIPILASFEDTGSIERDQEFFLPQLVDELQKGKEEGFTESFYLRGRIDYYQEIPSVAYIKVNDEIQWLQSLDIIANSCNQIKRVKEVFLAPTNEVINFKLSLKSKDRQLVKLKFGINYDPECNKILAAAQALPEKIVPFEFKEINIVRSL